MSERRDATTRRYLAVPMPRKVLDLEARVGLLEDAVRHVLRYGKVGKQSEARLRAALLASETSGEVDV